MQRLLEDKAAIVTGGSQGLGLAIATALAMDGAKVLIVARTEENVRSAVEQIESRGGVAKGFPADVTAPGAAAPP